MPNYPSNIWLITKDQFENFTFGGGKVIYIAEDVEPNFRQHSAIITAGALLPPMESIQYELDGRLLESSTLYNQYLMSEEADPFILIILAAAIKQIPIAIMFGKEEMELQFPKVFLDFLFNTYGVVIGIINVIQPYIIEQVMPYNLARLYCMNIIDYPTFMEKHPPIQIHPMAISKLAYDQNPVVKSKDLQHYVEYFETVRKNIYSNGGKFLFDPLVSS